MGATYKTKSKLSKKEQEELFIKMAKAIALLRGPEEVAYFLKDLLSEAEVFMLARRLQIAEMLVSGLTYGQIAKKLKVSAGTISRVQTWLEVYGEGYRTIVKRLGSAGDDYRESDSEPAPFRQIKRRYPMYHWPELLLKEVVKAASRKEKERLTAVLEQLKEKTKLTQDLKRILNS